MTGETISKHDNIALMMTQSTDRTAGTKTTTITSTIDAVEYAAHTEAEDN